LHQFVGSIGGGSKVKLASVIQFGVDLSGSGGLIIYHSFTVNELQIRIDFVLQLLKMLGFVPEMVVRNS
jgi:hypothetical protein